MKPTAPAKKKRLGLSHGPKAPLLGTLMMAGLLLGSSPGSALAQTDDGCQPTTHDDLMGMIDEAESLLALVEYAEALSQLASIETKLPCTQGPISQAQITRIFIFRGVTWFYLNSEDAAYKEFSKALAISPDYQWDVALGQRPKAIFDKAKQRNNDVGTVDLTYPHVIDGVEFAIDGNLGQGGESQAFHPGNHLLQYKSPDGMWSGLQFTVVDHAAQQVAPIPEEFTALPPANGPETDPTNPAVDPVTSPPEPDYIDQFGYEEKGWVKAGLWSGIGLTTAGFITVTVAGTQYLASNKVLEDYYQDETDPLRIIERDAELQRNSKLATATNLGWVITGLGAATAATFIVLDGRQSSLSLHPHFSPNHMALSVSGRF